MQILVVNYQQFVFTVILCVLDRLLKLTSPFLLVELSIDQSTCGKIWILYSYPPPDRKDLQKRSAKLAGNTWQP